MVSDWVVGLKCLAGDERHDLVDKKNDHSSKHGQDRRPEWPAEQLRLAAERWQPDVEVRLERIR